MYYAAIKKCNIANGPGCRTALFVSGCTHHCEGCFNQEAWDFRYGNPYTQEVENEVMDSLRPDYIRGLTLLGGEPLEPSNQQALLPLLRRVRAELPNKTIWCYSGYNWERDILPGHLGDPAITRELIGYLDVLVDGEFHLAEKNIRLRFRGSANQRIIDVPQSLAAGAIVLWDGTATP
jgi:anaerobic ribonucleoside-triphosphate reductase activating protein